MHILSFKSQHRDGIKITWDKPGYKKVSKLSRKQVGCRKESTGPGTVNNRSWKATYQGNRQIYLPDQERQAHTGDESIQASK